MSRSRSIILATLAVLITLATGTARAQQTLYGITWINELITIDTTNGSAKVVGMLSSDMKSAGIGFRGNKLYAWDNNAKRIQEINPLTAATVNTIDIGVNFFGEGDMVFRSDGIGFLTGFSPLFFSFDITVPNSVALPALNPTFDGLAFDSKDVLYGMSQAQPGTAKLYTIDTVTGVATLIGDTGITGFPSGGMAFDAADNLYAAFANGVATVYKIDKLTAAPTLVGNNAYGIVGIRFGPANPGVTISESGGSTNVTEGGATDTYTVVLNTAPTANVTITLNPGTQVTVAPATLTFTPANWNVAQTVTVTAVDDALVEGPHTGTITHTAASADAAYTAVAIAKVVANITDNDGPPPPPAVGTLYGITVSTNELITINTATGVGTLVGPLSSNMSSWGIASRANQLFAWDGTASRLRELNPATGATVNTINIGAIPGPFGEGDMAFRSDGIGFLTAQPGIGQLWRFDPTVPNSSLVGVILPAMDGLAFNSAGVLYGLANGGATLHTIDPATAITTLVGNTGIVGFGPNTSGGLSFDSSGNLFAALSDWPPGPSTLFRINTATGASTLVGNIGFVGISGITFALPPVPPPPPPPPTPGGGISEGSYAGSKGPTIATSEGAFGFGRHAGRAQHPILRGPYRDPLGTFRVFNAAHHQTVQAADGDNGFAPLGWTLFSAAALGLIGLLAAKYRAT